MTKQWEESLLNEISHLPHLIWFDWPFSPNASQVVWGLRSLLPATQLRRDLQYQNLQGSHKKKKKKNTLKFSMWCWISVWSMCDQAFMLYLNPSVGTDVRHYSPSSSKEGTPNLSSWSSDSGVAHFPMISAVMDSAGNSTASIRLMRVWNRL